MYVSARETNAYFALCSPNKTHLGWIQACALAMFLPRTRDWSIACIALNLACLMDIEILARV